MNLHVLGCAGGIGGREQFTTCLRLDNDILLDAGIGLMSLDLDALAAIDHVFITHGHLDHVAGLALLVDAVQTKRAGHAGPVTAYATPEVLALLKKHLFNWALWPDFSVIPSKENPMLRWQVIEPGKAVELNGRVIRPHSVNHTPGSVAYWVHNTQSGFLFTGDLSTTPELWAALAREEKLTKVIVDCSFSNADAALAAKAFHYCPQSLLADIESIPHSVEFLISHLKPGQEELIMNELKATGRGRAFRAVARGEMFTF